MSRSAGRRWTTSERRERRLDAGRKRGRSEEAADERRERKIRLLGLRGLLEGRLRVYVQGVIAVRVLESRAVVRGSLHAIMVAVVVVVSVSVFTPRMDVRMIAAGMMMGVETRSRERTRRREKRYDGEGTRPKAARA